MEEGSSRGSSTLQALALTFLGAAGTGLGGLMVVAQPKMDFKRLGLLQGLAAGLMLSISLTDLLPEAAEEIGVIAANISFYLGVAFFAVVVHFIPEPEVLVRGNTEPPRIDVTAVAAAAAARPPSPPAAAVRSCPQLATRGSAQLDSQAVPYSAQNGMRANGKLSSSSSSKASSSRSVDDEDDKALKHKRQVLMSGLITAVGIGLHNFPEGVAVFLAAYKCKALGISLAAAIALHNIPEGVAVALPVYFATGSRWQGFSTAFLSGLAEPLAVVMVGLLFPGHVSKTLIDYMLAAVGGIMAFLSFHELLPLSIQHAGKGAAISALFAGMAFMSVNLHILNTYVLGGLH